MSLFLGPDEQPLFKPQDVIAFLGRGEQHWKEGRSAFEAAHSWFALKNIPASIQAILNQVSDFEGAVLEKAVFEKKTKLDSYGRESQTDIMAFLKVNDGRAVVGVEAKVDESFGPLVREWNDYGTGKLRRLAGILDRLKFGSIAIGELRYQLFHRVAATLIEAQHASARHAAVIVQSFVSKRTGFEDFVAFANAFGASVTAPGKLSQPRAVGEVTMRLGWTENPLHRPTR